jgi:hypothetical protein
MSSLPGSVEHPLLPCVQGLIWVNSGGRGQRDLSSGLPPTADVAAVNGLRFRANSRLMQRSKMVSLFDHFVDATEQR